MNSFLSSPGVLGYSGTVGARWGEGTKIEIFAYAGHGEALPLSAEFPSLIKKKQGLKWKYTTLSEFH